MRKLLLLWFCSVLCYCTCNKKKELLFLNKNAYTTPVWQEILLQEEFKINDVIEAFEAYASTHVLDNETKEHFEKIEKDLKANATFSGFYISKRGKFKELLRYRKALPNKLKTNTFNLKNLDVIEKTIPNPKNKGNWKNLGPFGDPDVKWSATGNGAIQYIEMHPTNPAIMYAASRNGGLWKTVDYGKTWTPETDHFPTNNTSCLAISKQNPEIMYLGAAEDQKVWYTTNGGNSWRNKSNGLKGVIYDIHVDPANVNRVIVATSKGIYVTVDSGSNWKQKIEGRFTDIDITKDWKLILVSKDNEAIKPVLYFSKDKGDSFIEQAIITYVDTVDRFYLAIHQPVGTAPKIYAYGLNDANKPTRFIGLWKSDYNKNPQDGKTYFNFKEVKHPIYRIGTTLI